jgi:hypothetical protein
MIIVNCMLRPPGLVVYQDKVWVGMTEKKQLAYRGLVSLAVCHIRRRKSRQGTGDYHIFYNMFVAWDDPFVLVFLGAFSVILPQITKQTEDLVNSFFHIFSHLIARLFCEPLVDAIVQRLRYENRSSMRPGTAASAGMRLALAIVSIVMVVPLTAIILGTSVFAGWITPLALIFLYIAIIAINIAFNYRS